MSNLVEKAKLFAEYAHRNQYRFDGSTPYFTHCEAVANSLSEDTRKAIAYLHDVLEDTTVTVEDLKIAGFNILVKRLGILNKHNYSSYAEYLKAVKEDPVCKDVKIKDIEHNNSDKPSKRMKQKYLNALLFLRDKIDYATLEQRLVDLYK